MRRRDFLALVGVTTILRPARAKMPKRYRVGFLGPGNFGPATVPGYLSDEITRQLAHSGLSPGPGANLELIKLGAGRNFERLHGLAAELVAAKVDVIVAFGYPAAAAAKEATSTVPVVILGTGDPVKTHLVQSLNRPGGNVTGISDVAAELAPKRLGLLKEAAPKLQRVAMLWNAEDLGMTMRYAASAEAARILGIRVQALGVREAKDFDAAFAAMVHDTPDGLLMVADALTFLNRERVNKFAATHRLPAICENAAFARDGGLMSYGPDEVETAERGANLIRHILAGDDPADLPFEQPTRFRLVINLKTAKAIDLAIPPTLVATADEVVE